MELFNSMWVCTKTAPIRRGVVTKWHEPQPGKVEILFDDAKIKPEFVDVYLIKPDPDRACIAEKVASSQAYHVTEDACADPTAFNQAYLRVANQTLTDIKTILVDRGLQYEEAWHALDKAVQIICAVSCKNKEDLELEVYRKHRKNAEQNR